MPEHENVENIVEAYSAFATNFSSNTGGTWIPATEEFPFEEATEVPVVTDIDGSIYRPNGTRIAQTTPRISAGAWIVDAPGGDHFATERGSVYFDTNTGMEFTCIREISSGTWEIIWEDQIQAEYDEFDYDIPFEYGGRWYVVMRPGSGLRTGQYLWSDEHEGEYRLGRRVRDDLFGSSEAFRVDWSDEEVDIDDGYSVERDEIDARTIEPVLATNIGRTIPLVSIEQEFSGDGDMVAQKLYAAGFCYNRYPDGYHQSDMRYDSETDRICYVETDSSCGYELIFSKIDLTSRTIAGKISAAQQIMRELKDQERIRLSARCGFHIHIDVSDWGMKEIVSAYHLWNYLEDPIFRFASAFWGSHRDEEVGGGYSSPVPKGYQGRTAIAQNLNERRDSLNFSHILRAKGNCRCGASIYEDWANCTCNLPQPTLEFRVFNATLNQRKIKAYLAFCVGFVNLAKKTEHTPESFPEMRWRGTFAKNESWDEDTVERLKYILNEFPLTNAEKTDIQYCFRNSSLEPIVDRL